MLRAAFYFAFATAPFSFVVFQCCSLFAQSVQFDCPAVQQVSVAQNDDAGKQIAINIPVSASINDTHFDLEELKVELFWNRNPQPIVDFSPRTTLGSRYAGNISIEKQSSANLNAGVGVTSSYLKVATPTIDTGAGYNTGETRRFEEVPQQEVQLAAGTIYRGTGVQFTFAHSRTQTLVGSKDLSATFAVPPTWRAGVMQVNCHAHGSRRHLGLIREPVDISRTFVVPVFLEDDLQAREHATAFSRTEQQLRFDWNRFLVDSSRGFNQLERVFPNNSQLPEQWAHYLIQRGSDTAVAEVESRLPEKVASAANEFVRARQNLLSLSR